MKCAYHPDQEADTLCAKCNTPLCGRCTGNTSEEGENICVRCVAVLAAADFGQDKNRRLEEAEQRRQALREEKKRRSRRKRNLALAAVCAVVIVNFILYATFKVTLPESEKFIPAEMPETAVIVVDAAVQDYAEDHNGRFPDNLEMLLGKYLIPEELKAEDLVMFQYRKTAERNYELRIVVKGEEESEEMVITEKGPEP